MIKNLIKITNQMLTNRIYSLEGNIGCGKSTILEHLANKKDKNTICIQEPVQQWTSTDTGTDLLKLFYENKDRWSFCFENLVQLSRIKTHYECVLNQSSNRNLFIERSIHSSFHVFAQNSYEENNLNKNEFDILTKYYELFSSNNNDSFTKHIPLSIIYLKSSPNECLKRIRSRNRVSESAINIDYLNRINSKYENWISSLNESNVIILDANSNKDELLNQVDQLFFLLKS